MKVFRRFFPLQFGVRTLIFFVLLLAVALGWIIHRMRVQRDAVVAIRQALGDVRYDWDWKDGQAGLGAPKWPEWMVNRLGVDYFGSVTQVTFYGSGRAGAPPNFHLSRLNKVESINLSYENIYNLDLKYLSNLKKLRELNLAGTKITDDGLAHLKTLKNLSWLNLADTNVSRNGFLKLKECLPNLSISQ